MTRNVTITMSLKEAERISEGLADLLCWHAGFAAGSVGHEHRSSGDDPMNVGRMRQMRVKLLDAMNEAERAEAGPPAGPPNGRSAYVTVLRQHTGEPIVLEAEGYANSHPVAVERASKAAARWPGAPLAWATARLICAFGDPSIIEDLNRSEA